MVRWLNENNIRSGPDGFRAGLEILYPLSAKEWLHYLITSELWQIQTRLLVSPEKIRGGYQRKIDKPPPFLGLKSHPEAKLHCAAGLRRSWDKENTLRGISRNRELVVIGPVRQIKELKCESSIDALGEFELIAQS